MQKQVTFAIAGFGDRGSTYASMQDLFPDKMKVVAVADLNSAKVKKAQNLYQIPEANCFSSAEEMFQAGKLADVMCICTMDRQHVGHAIPAIELGYDILLEKPVSPELDKCNKLLDIADKNNAKIIVCHVLRYTAFYNQVRDIISLGKLGDIVSVNASENVGYWHHAHSFVRGNWRNSKETSPMILQKSCHDMDILLWLTGKTCESVSSIGGISLFKEEKAPAASTSHCLGGCKAKESCVFDAEKIYLKNPATGIENGNSWISSVLSVENTIDSTYKALKSSESQYGRCVYHCDNDVVDHQQTNLLMTDGSTIGFTMSAFTENCYRTLRVMGTKGELEADTKSNIIRVRVFGKEEEIINLQLMQGDLKGHGGGDSGIIKDLLESVSGNQPPNERTTTLLSSMNSHYVALAAEESRLNGGKVVAVNTFANSQISEI